METAGQENITAIFASPQVDGDIMLWSVQNRSTTLSPEPALEFNIDPDLAQITEPDLEIPFSARFMLDAEPRVDENAFSQRLRVEGLEDEGLGPWPLGFSILWHVVIAAMVFGFIQFAEIPNSLEKNISEPIEVSFGLSLDAGRALPDGKIADERMDAEATKTLQLLPQLPKLLTVDAATPAPVDNSMTMPNSVSATPAPTAVPTVTAPPKVAATPTPGPTVQQIDPAATKKLKLEELAKRLEKEQRAVGAKEKAGVQKPSPNDTFKRPSDIPISPLGKDIPKAPTALTQAGMLTGKISPQVKSEYAQAAASHMKKHWSLPDVLSFESRLEVVLGFDINTAGKIMGRVRVVRGSGNARFDEEAMKALEAAGPFPDLPKEMGSKLTLRMKFSPQSINF